MSQEEAHSQPLLLPTSGVKGGHGIPVTNTGSKRESDRREFKSRPQHPLPVRALAVPP